MKLYYYCSSPSCKKTNSINVKSNNRFDLKHEIGEEINKRCKHCGTYTKRHINRLHADTNNLIIIGGAILAGLITFLLWDFGYVSTLSGTIPIGIWAHENKKASEFNKQMI